MSFLRSLAFHRHAAAWLFAWVLLLPFAQAAALCHAYVHDQAKLEAVEGKPAPNAGHCDLCLTAATVGGGAWVAEPLPPALLASASALLPAGAESVRVASPAHAYRSRAPPARTIGS